MSAKPDPRTAVPREGGKIDGGFGEWEGFGNFHENICNCREDMVYYLQLSYDGTFGPAMARDSLIISMKGVFLNP